MSYESGTNGLNVGQRYGVREVGNVQGVTCATSGEGRMVFEFDGTSPTALAAQSFSIPEGYAVITAAYLETEVAFASGTVDIDVDGTPINTAPEVLNVLGVSDMPLGTVESISSANVVTVSNPTAAVAAAGGSYAKVIVEFTRV
jgi:hypothetical protein